jgi:hypothetical protein
MNQGKVYQVAPRITLDAQLTVMIEARPGGSTKASARAAYVVTRGQSATTANGKPLAFTDTISFKTGGTGTFPNAATKCHGTGKLEADALPAGF